MDIPPIEALTNLGQLDAVLGAVAAAEFAAQSGRRGGAFGTGPVPGTSRGDGPIARVGPCRTGGRGTAPADVDRRPDQRSAACPPAVAAREDGECLGAWDRDREKVSDRPGRQAGRGNSSAELWQRPLTRCSQAAMISVVMPPSSSGPGY